MGALTPRRDRLVELSCLLAGAGDTLTGIALVSRPSVVLEPLRLAGVGASDPLLGLVGALVLGVGLGTLAPWLAARGRGRAGRLTGSLALTAIQRTVVALALARAVLGGSLPGSWLLVAAYDAGWALWTGILVGRLAPEPPAAGTAA